jgi:hypothetical protein
MVYICHSHLELKKVYCSTCNKGKEFFFKKRKGLLFKTWEAPLNRQEPGSDGQLGGHRLQLFVTSR